MVTVIHTILVVLALPRNGVAALIERMNAIIAAMSAHTATFTTPPIAFSVAASHVAALETAQTATKARTPGSIATRDAARLLVLADAKQLHAYVQLLVNTSPTQAANIAADAAMTLRKRSAHPKQDLTVKQGTSGVAHLSAKSVRGAVSHEWQFSTDGGKTWNSASPTAQARTTIGNLPPGVVQFRQRALTRKGPGDWTPPLSVGVS
jgi:hypothetical protein